MLRLFGGTLLCFIPFLAVLSGEPWTARQLGFAGLTTPLHPDPGNLVVNPAAIAPLRTLRACVSVNPGAFGLSELQSKAAVVLMRMGEVSVGIGIRRFGFDLYNETSLIVGTAATVQEDLHAGISLEARNIVIRKYGSAILPHVTVGMLYNVSEPVVVGGRIANVLGAKLGHARERLPRTAGCGLTYLPVPWFLASVELEKDTRSPLILKCGVEFQLVPLLSIRGGIVSDPSLWAVGGTVRASPVEFTYGGSFHPVLGWTHSIDLGFRLPE